MNGSVSQLNLALSRFFRMAVVAGVESAVRIHIERGDDLNARDSGGQTPLMLAAARNKPHICKLLLDAGADPTSVESDVSPITPLESATTVSSTHLLAH